MVKERSYFFGKIHIIKTHALSKLVLPISMLEMPNEYIKKVESIFYKFLWGKRTEKIKRGKLVCNVSEGGLNMTDISSFTTSLLAYWIVRLNNANPTTDAWAQLPSLYFKELKEINSNLLFNFDKSSKFPLSESLPSFYSNVFKSYNLVFTTNKTLFEQSIMNQIVWGNKFITFNTGKKKNVLFLRNWIRSGIRTVKDLGFQNGMLDEQYMYTKIRNKTNIVCEIALVKKALLPFQNAIRSNNSQVLNFQEPAKSNEIYKALLLTNMDTITFNSNYLNNLVALEDEKIAFKNKVVLEKEVKLREFNYKLLHGILPCNYNLNKWTIKHSCICDVCDQSQTIQHLLFDCRYVKPLWNIVNATFGIQVTYEQILGIDQNFHYNSITTLICFLIYKEWLVHSIDGKNRYSNIQFNYFKNELTLRLSIYALCTCIDVALINSINTLLSAM